MCATWTWNPAPSARVAAPRTHSSTGKPPGRSGPDTACREPRPSVSRLGVRRRNRSEEHTSELQSHVNLVCRLLLEKKKKQTITANVYDAIYVHAICKLRLHFHR